MGATGSYASDETEPAGLLQIPWVTEAPLRVDWPKETEWWWIHLFIKAGERVTWKEGRSACTLTREKITRCKGSGSPGKVEQGRKLWVGGRVGRSKAFDGISKDPGAAPQGSSPLLLSKHFPVNSVEDAGLQSDNRESSHQEACSHLPLWSASLVHPFMHCACF